MNTQPNFFELFDLPQRFALDDAALDAAYKRVQAQVHPDRFVTASPAEKRVAMQWAVRANEGLQTLKDAGKRAAYLCEQHGVAIDAESNTAMPTEFLMQQMQWREALEDARAARDTAAARALQNEVAQTRAAAIEQLHELIDVRKDYVSAAQRVRQLMFVDKFAAEIDGAVEALLVAVE